MYSRRRCTTLRHNVCHGECRNMWAYGINLCLLFFTLVASLPHWAAPQSLGTATRVSSSSQLRRVLQSGARDIVITDHMDIRELPSADGSSATVLAQEDFTISVQPLQLALRCLSPKQRPGAIAAST